MVVTPKWSTGPFSHMLGNPEKFRLIEESVSRNTFMVMHYTTPVYMDSTPIQRSCTYSFQRNPEMTAPLHYTGLIHLLQLPEHFPISGC